MTLDDFAQRVEWTKQQPVLFGLQFCSSYFKLLQFCLTPVGIKSSSIETFVPFEGRNIFLVTLKLEDLRCQRLKSVPMTPPEFADNLHPACVTNFHGFFCNLLEFVKSSLTSFQVFFPLEFKLDLQACCVRSTFTHVNLNCELVLLASFFSFFVPRVLRTLLKRLLNSYDNSFSFSLRLQESWFLEAFPFRICTENVHILRIRSKTS